MPTIMTHSVVAVCAGFTLGGAAIPKRFWVLAIIAAVLPDGMTDGGRGVALLAPYSNERYFLPWTPIEVSPLGVRAFFSQRGLTVMKSEMLWVWLPAVTLAILWWMIRRNYPISKT
jgi:inner membrane protein